MKVQHIDQLLDRYDTNKLKRLARLFGGSNTLRKQEAIDHIRISLGIPSRVKTMISNLQPYQQAALAIVKQYNNYIHHHLLALYLYMRGGKLPKHRFQQNDNDLIQWLVNSGLFLHHGYSYSHWHDEIYLFTDSRILKQIAPLTYNPFSLPTINDKTPIVLRPPHTVVLDIIAMLQLIEQVGSFPLTKTGTVRVNSIRKFRKALGWQKDDVFIDGVIFPKAAQAFIEAFQQTGILKQMGNELILDVSLENLSTKPYHEQIKMVFDGFLKLTNWNFDKNDYSYRKIQYNQGRQLILFALACLPIDTDELVSFDAFSEAIFKRIGQHFSLEHLKQRPYYFKESKEEIEKLEAIRLRDIQKSWQKLERPWIKQFLCTWPYYLGLIALQMKDGQPINFQLTNLGRSILHPELSETLKKPNSARNKTAWIIQPNFEVMVYLEQATPEQLIFLERHAERIQVQRHIAQYQLTRNSVYQGLENGTELDSLIQQLQLGAGKVLPQNVLIELQEWGRLREQIALHYIANLLEFTTTTERDNALQQGLPGKAIGERFVMVKPTRTMQQWVNHTVDYQKPMPRCLSINEGGLIKIKRDYHDLLLDAQISKWAEAKTNRIWHITEHSVKKAISAKGEINELFNLLDERLLIRKLPAFLDVALQNWGKKKKAVISVTNITVIRCTDPDLYRAITYSRKLKPYIKGTLGTDLLLIDNDNLTEVTKVLAWAGLDITDMIVL